MFIKTAQSKHSSHLNYEVKQKSTDIKLPKKKEKKKCYQKDQIITHNDDV